MTLPPLFSILPQRLEAFLAQSLGFLVQYFYLALQNLLLLAQLPPDVRKILATSTKTEVEDLASEADRVVEVSRLTHISSIRAVPESESSSVNALTSGKDRQTKKRNEWPMIPSLCKYHSKFGEKAWNCAPPCKMSHLTAQQSENGRAGRR